jgi:hypothetical protein
LHSLGEEDSDGRDELSEAFAAEEGPGISESSRVVMMNHYEPVTSRAADQTGNEEIL